MGPGSSLLFLELKKTETDKLHCKRGARKPRALVVVNTGSQRPRRALGQPGVALSDLITASS
jgi:hypothetical protein